MKRFPTFESYNAYLGLSSPLDEDIDVGYYDAPRMRSQSEPIVVDFYRISIKINVVYNGVPVAKPITAVYFNSPNMQVPVGWDVVPTYEGMYLQLSKKFIEENRHLFRNYLDYGQHEALYPQPEEVEEIKGVFALLNRYCTLGKSHRSVLVSYVNVLIALVETYYRRQFATDPKRYNRIVSDFRMLVLEYYDNPVQQIPSVQYFADQLGLTSNYLGDIIKHFTQKSPIEHLHECAVEKAKRLLESRHDLNTTEVGYELGFEYPNYFAKFFKKHVGMTPKEYRLKATVTKP